MHAVCIRIKFSSVKGQRDNLPIFRIVVYSTHPFMEVRLMNQDRADLARECQACNGKESDLSMDFIRKISAVLSG